TPPPSDPAGALLAAMLGIPLEMTVGPDGRTVAVRGDEAMRAALLDAVRRSVPGGATGQVEAMLDGFDVGRTAEQSFTELPGGTLEPGAEWSRDVEMDTPLGVTRQSYR